MQRSRRGRTGRGERSFAWSAALSAGGLQKRIASTLPANKNAPGQSSLNRLKSAGMPNCSPANHRVSFTLEGVDQRLDVARPPGLERQVDLGIADGSLQKRPIMMYFEDVRPLGGNRREHPGQHAWPVGNANRDHHPSAFDDQTALDDPGNEVGIDVAP